MPTRPVQGGREGLLFSAGGFARWVSKREAFLFNRWCSVLGPLGSQPAVQLPSELQYTVFLCFIHLTLHTTNQRIYTFACRLDDCHIRQITTTAAFTMSPACATRALASR